MSTKRNLKTLLYQALTLYETEGKLVGLPEGRPIWFSEQEFLVLLTMHVMKNLLLNERCFVEGYPDL